MNAIEENIFTDSWQAIGDDLKNIRAVLVISAHWLTRGSFVTAMESPRTIHDFGGFPRALFEVEYAAPGSPEIAGEIVAALDGIAPVQLDSSWGLDHGTWSVLIHLFPDAAIPVLQLSIDAAAAPENYLEIGRALRPLRERGILIIGSGNIVHNLQLVDWKRLNELNYAFSWASEADALAQKWIREKNHTALTQFEKMPQSLQTAINSAEHFIPLLYIMGAALPEEEAVFFNSVAIGGSLTMTSVRFSA